MLICSLVYIEQKRIFLKHYLIWKEGCLNIYKKLIFSGHCKCGSQLEGEIMPNNEQENIIKIRFHGTAGTEECGKRECRGETRRKIVKKLENASVLSYRTLKAADALREGDTSEPPHLYEANVLSTAKYQFRQKQYKDENPIIALSKLKRCVEGENVIRDIGYDPVKVLFWSPHQVRAYNNFLKMQDCCLCIDATGKLSKHIIHVDGNKSQHIFLYLGVLSYSNGSFTVPAMFSERQDTVTISNWLMRWIQSGAEYPKEVVRITFYRNENT